MPDSTFDQAGLSATLRAQENVLSRQQAFAHGMTRSSLAHRISPGGPWQRLLAGVGRVVGPTIGLLPAQGAHHRVPVYRSSAANE